MLENTEGVMEKDNPDKLATQVHKTQEKINVREYGRVNEKIKSKETGNIGYTTNKTNKCQRIPKGKYKRTIQINWQDRAQDAGQINVR